MNDLFFKYSVKELMKAFNVVIIPPRPLIIFFYFIYFTRLSLEKRHMPFESLSNDLGIIVNKSYIPDLFKINVDFFYKITACAWCNIILRI